MRSFSPPKKTASILNSLTRNKPKQVKQNTFIMLCTKGANLLDKAVDYPQAEKVDEAATVEPIVNREVDLTRKEETKEEIFFQCEPTVDRARKSTEKLKPLNYQGDI